MLSTRAWIALAVGLAGALAAALILLSVLGSEDSGPEVAATGTLVGATEVEELFAGVPQDGVTLGSPDAPVTLVEFADLQCPFCAQWAAESLPVLVRDYVRAGRLRIEFRPLAFIGDDSEKAARYALAAGEQGKLWQATDLTYMNQGAENSGWVSDDFLAALGRSIEGLDADAARAAADSDAVADELAAAAQEAEEAGIQSTPSFLLGPSGGKLEAVELTSLGPEGITPQIDALLE